MRIFLLLFVFYTLPIHAQLKIPKLEKEVKIDGNAREWKELAFHDGLWDMHRVSNSPWYNSRRNRLVNNDEKGNIGRDLSARYYIAYDSCYLYLAADVRDNINDVTESKHEPKRWYYKDAIAFFFEIPADTTSEMFEEGNHAFAFVADSTYPDYGAWWRHGTKKQAYIEEPLPSEYKIKLKRKTGSFTLEAKIDLCALGIDPITLTTQAKMMIVHCDPDGGEYGGHMLIHGAGDNDKSWTPVQFVGPKLPIERKAK